MTNTIKLEIAITRSGLKKREIASALGITAMGLYKKIHNLSEFKASEIIKLVKVLNLSNLEREEIFFDEDVDLKSTKLI